MIWPAPLVSLADQPLPVNTSNPIVFMSSSATLKAAQRSYDVVETDTGLRRLADSHYAPFLSRITKERKPSPIHGLFPLEATPGLISLLAGKPNSSMFPFTSLSFSTRSVMDPTQESLYTLEPEELAQALQYGETSGMKKLRDWFFGLQDFSHGRKRGEGWGIFIGTNSEELIYKAAHVLLDDGDSVLLESPVSAGVLPVFQALHCDLIEVETDAQGISTASLRTVLEHWPAGKRRPKVLYTVPNGCHSTGTAATLERRKEVLKMAREFDLIILEGMDTHDPYFYLYYGKAPRPPSYFALEKEAPEVGRVLRVDCLSKILSPGLLLGFVSGPEVFLQGIDRHTAAANLQPTSFTQVITYKLLHDWGYEGFKAHMERVSGFYGEKRDVFQTAMKKYMDGHAEWVVPEAGLFFWFKLKLTKNGEEDGDSESVIRLRAFDKAVLALPGRIFLPNGSKTAYVRAEFSLNAEDEVNDALRRLREAAIVEARADLTNGVGSIFSVEMVGNRGMEKN